MTYQSRLARFVFVVVVAACAVGGSALVSGAEGAPAGQMCPEGSYVIGFDSGSNIICSGAGEIVAPGAIETSEVGKAEAAGTCVGDCQPTDIETQGADTKIAGKSAPASPVVAPSIAAPGISGVKPTTVVFGTRQVEITISGTGFLEGSVVVFAGGKYTPSVNQAGTQLLVTLPTRDLSIGAYAVTVSNGPGMQTTMKRALSVY